MENEADGLQQRKSELERLLDDPGVLNDSERTKALAIELGKVEKELRKTTGAAAPESGVERAIVEIRAGTGGEEAALFAAELLRMYTSYAKRRGWNTTLIDSNPTDIGGYREAIIEIAGKDVYETMRHEAGVHRVQRIPATEKTGRIHTSTVSVAVLPEAKGTDVAVRPQDIRVEFFRSSGPGGQNVNKVETAVRIHHLPSGLVVTSQESRSQQKNREQAMVLLRAKLFEAERNAASAKTGEARRLQIGSAERAEKIRTYNFPQDRITDHRINKSWHHIEDILKGNLEPIVNALAGESS